MSRLRERREFRRSRTADDPRPGFRVLCGDPSCKRSTVMHSNKWLKIPNEQIQKFFEEQNWFVGRAADQDRCPEHSYRYRHERAHSAKEKATIEAKQVFAQVQEQKDQRLEAAISAYTGLNEEEQKQFRVQCALVPRSTMVEPTVALPAVEPEPPPPQLDEPTGIPFMITRAMKTKLRDQGLTDVEISNMLPADAHFILGDAPKPKPNLNGKPIETKAEPPVKTAPPPEVEDDDIEDDEVPAFAIQNAADIIFGRR